MRKIEALSHSALKLWESDRREYYLRYLCETRTPKIAQTEPMAVGAAFDGLVKNAIEKMCGLEIRDYSGQVELANRGIVDTLGKQVFDFYVKIHGIERLLISGKPRMEFAVKAPIPGTESCRGGPVVLSGKPDLYYKVAAGYRLIHDWKVNGILSKNPISPNKGFIWDSKNGMPHKDVIPKKITGLGGSIFVSALFAEEWMDQEVGYGWCMGEAVGDEFVVQVHQITKNSDSSLRLTEHRALTTIEHQQKLRDRYVGCWEAINSGRCFTDMSEEDDHAEQKHLDRVATGLQDPIFNKLVGR